MRDRTSVHRLSRVWRIVVVLLLAFGLLPRSASAAITTGGLGHLPGGLICNDAPYREPVNPPIGQGAIIRARSANADLQSNQVKLWYTTNANAAVQGDWTTINGPRYALYYNCIGGNTNANGYRATIPYPGTPTRVWYKIQYVDNNPTSNVLWQIAPGEGGTGISTTTTWTTSSTSLFYDYGLSVSTNQLSVAEGGPPATYTVVLSQQPIANVTVSFNATPGGQLEPLPALTFTPINWNTPQIVTVQPIDDSLIEGTHQVTITHSLASADPNFNGYTDLGAVNVTITDNDAAAVSIAPTAIAVTEGGATATYAISLTAQPTAAVTVNIAPDAQVTTSKTQVVFTAANWNTPQTVTVSAVDDAVVEGTHTGTITHSVVSTDPNFSALPASDVTATITDNDTAGVSVAPTSVNVTEGGATATYAIVLTSQPTANVVINLTTANGEATLAPTTVTFTPANWNAPQTVTVTAVDDAVAQGPHSDTVQHAAGSADPNYNGISVASVSVNISDNDTAAVSVAPTSVSVAEGGATATYAISLTSQPSADVTITIATGGQTTVAPTSLIFGTINWDTPQTVTVSAVDDTVVEGTHSDTITHTAASADANYDGSNVADVSVTISDNDTGSVTVVPTSIAVSEDGTTDSYTIVLDAQPSGNVIINITPDAQLTTDKSTLSFTPANWNTPQTVTVSAVDDAVVEGPHSGTIDHSVAAGSVYGSVSIASVTATITDNDTAGVSVAPTSIAVTEGGATATYAISLTSQPISTVTIDIATGGQTTVAPTSLTFDGSNWNTPQIVTVTALDDGIIEGPHTDTITHTVSSTDGNYDGSSVADVTVNITDNDVVGVSIAPTTLNLEEGESATYAISLTSQPTSAVTINLSLSNGEATATPLTITIAPAQWNVPQIVTVTAVDDAVDEGPHSTIISHTISSVDPTYDGFSAADVTVNISDNDEAGLSVVPTTIGVSENGGSATYALALTSQPVAAVTVMLNFDATQIDAAPTTLVFTPANWNTAQIVTVSAVDDTLEEGPHSTTIAHTTSSADANYDGLEATVQVNIADNDVPGVLVTPTALTTAEGGAGVTYTVVLLKQPSSVLTLTLATAPAGQIDVSPMMLVFTPANWSTPQIVTVTAIDDTLVEGPHTAIISHSIAAGSAADYAGVVVDDVSVAITDNDSGPTSTTLYLPLVLNTATPPVPATSADLVVSDFRLVPNKTTFTAGEPVQVEVTITNVGGTATESGFWVDLYINPSQAPTTVNVPWNTVCGITPCFGIVWEVAALAPGESITLTSAQGNFRPEYSIWEGWFASGTTDLYVYADSYNRADPAGAVAEADETNNRAEIHGVQVTGTNPPTLHRSPNQISLDRTSQQ